MSQAQSNPWVIQASGGDPVPVGSYFAEFKGVEPFDKIEKDIQGKFRWSWVVAAGKFQGKEISALTDQRLTTGNHASRLIAGMAGRALQVGEDVQSLVDSFKGKRFCTVVSAGPKGGKPSVQSATLPPEM